MDLRLKGRRVLVTGGSQGIGFAVAKGFIEEGCDHSDLSYFNTSSPTHSWKRSSPKRNVPHLPWRETTL